MVGRGAAGGAVTAEELIAFERAIAQEYDAGHIRAPVHLSGGNERQLIRIFRDVRATDYVLCQWRSHYHALLHGVPPEKVKAAIMAGRSITLCFPEHRFLCSAIAGGHLPIALGIAWQIKREGRGEKVFAFCGDMTASMGIAHECFKYAHAFNLPIHWVIEVNGKSVCTDTKATWNNFADYIMRSPSQSTCYDYELLWPHSGAGKRVNF